MGGLKSKACIILSVHLRFNKTPSQLPKGEVFDNSCATMIKAKKKT